MKTRSTIKILLYASVIHHTTVEPHLHTTLSGLRKGGLKGGVVFDFGRGCIPMDT